MAILLGYRLHDGDFAWLVHDGSMAGDAVQDCSLTGSPVAMQRMGIIVGMTPPPPPADNANDPNYAQKIRAIADQLTAWEGPIVVISHVDPDGDALGSTLTLARALRRLGKDVTLPMEPPAFLRFLVEEGELSGPLDALPDGALLAVLDVAELARSEGAPHEGAAFVLNVDHHGTNERFGDLALVNPGSAATAQMIKDVVDALPVTWDEALATPCLTGMLTDTGTFRYANTDRDVLRAAGDLMGHGVSYVELTDRLQWRPESYYRMLGAVMDTLELPFGGRATLATVTLAMKERFQGANDDSDDYVGVIRYVEGSQVAIMLKEHEDAVKISVRARAPISAQAICIELGGGGHVAAAGAKLVGVTLEDAKRQVLAAVEQELDRHPS